MSEGAHVQDELVRLENQVHWPQAGTSRAAMAQWFAEDFWEVGASGRKFTLAVVLNVLEKRAAAGAAAEPRTLSDVACRALAADTFLLTYLLEQPGRLTRRSSVWRRTADGWRMLHHQGTVVPVA
ncbi:DUF4440 domain-containing protein [Oleiharenicola sp. Vm1]|uniref:nuclear transport factor 2 family protein n=1 Tax=Oleiharenicola sp. Vm1 TaxID=3398393 RepID=UPI0039F53878